MVIFRLKYWVLAAISLTFAIACSQTPSQLSNTTDCRTVSHVLGTSEVCGHPEKIVALDGHSLDLLLSLGEQPAGAAALFPVGDTIDRPSEQIPYLGQFITTKPTNISSGLASGPSLETITALKPDLIVGEYRYLESHRDLISQIAPIIPLDVRSQRGKWQENIRALAIALGEERKADDAIARYAQSIAAMREKLAPIVAATPKILVLTAESLNGGTFSAISPQSYLGELLEGLGFELVSPPSNTNYAPVSVEVLPELNDADLIFVLGFSRDIASLTEEAVDTQEIRQQQLAGIQQEWSDSAIAQSLTASQAGRVYFTTFFEWNFYNGPLGTELVLQQLRQFLLEN